MRFGAQLNAPAVVRRKSGEAGVVRRGDHTLALVAFELQSTPSTLTDCRAATRRASSTKLGRTSLCAVWRRRAKFHATGSNRRGVGRGGPPTAPSPRALFDRPRPAVRRRSAIGRCRSQGNCTTVPPTRGKNLVAIAERLPERRRSDCDRDGPVTVRFNPGDGAFLRDGLGLGLGLGLLWLGLGLLLRLLGLGLGSGVRWTVERACRCPSEKWRGRPSRSSRPHFGTSRIRARIDSFDFARLPRGDAWS